VRLLVQGLPTVFHTTFTAQNQIMDYRGYQQCALDLQTQFVTLLRERGINITGRGVWFLSAAHTEADVAETLEIVREVLVLPGMNRADAYETARALP
jgi:glutamate-1-semialdehyde 2,1-aminomutase